MRDILVTLLQLLLFFGSWGLPTWIGDYWARSNVRRRPRPHPDDYRFNEESRQARERELTAAEDGEYDAYLRSGQTAGAILMMACIGLSLYLPMLLH